MFYERSQEITERVDKALSLIQTGKLFNAVARRLPWVSQYRLHHV